MATRATSKPKGMGFADMRTNDIAKMLASELVGPKRIFDESAETTREIEAKTGLGQSAILRRISKQIKAGIIEQVWKRGERGPVPAYRAKVREMASAE